MSMLPSPQAGRGSFHLHVCTRSRAATPFLERLDALRELGLVTFHHDEGVPQRGIDLGTVLANADEGVHAYCCGPQPLLDAFVAAASHWPAAMVHFERFGAMAAAGSAYELELARSGRCIDVREGETMANALKRHGVEVKTSCEAGICGLCKVEYISGDPDHRDYVLTEEDRKHCLMPCVSSSKGTKLVLNL
jgi:vanillate O-demethylase ferredoxin subunit